MLSAMRNKWGLWVVGGIIVFIGFVFVFSGVFTPDPSFTGGGSAGKVNGEMISLRDYHRLLNQRLNTYRSMGFKEAQLKALNVGEGVFRELVDRTLILQEAKKRGFLPSQYQIIDEIKKIQAFQKDGKFDKEQYKQVLSANNFTPGSFEKLIKDDLMVNELRQYFGEISKVSSEEVRREFRFLNNKRDIRYVLLTPKVGEKGVKVSQKEIKEFLKDSVNQNRVQAEFDSKKGTEFKGKKFEKVKNQIASRMLKVTKTKEADDFRKGLAKKVSQQLTSASSSEKKVNALLKSVGAKVETAKGVNEKRPFLPGVGEAKELISDAFRADSPILKKAKTYELVSGTLIAVLSKVEKPNFKELTEERRQETLAQLTREKQQNLFRGWLEKKKEQAKIVKNDSIVQ